MREIKFRAWDKKRKHWNYFTLNNINTYLKYLQEHLLNGNEFYLYTGLKDKKGVEIFEGDICEDGHELHGACFRFLVKDIREVYIIQVRWNYVKIIGNIYENSELLKGK